MEQNKLKFQHFKYIIYNMKLKFLYVVIQIVIIILFPYKHAEDAKNLFQYIAYIIPWN